MGIRLSIKRRWSRRNELKAKKARYLASYEAQKGMMDLVQIKFFIRYRLSHISKRSIRLIPTG
ncbi:hypothetical protein [Hydrogenimonas sp.]